MTETIENLTVEEGLCVSCGICAGACPKACISFCRDKGQYLPKIDHDRCIHCGVCADVCPSSVKGEDYEGYARINGCEWREEDALWGTHRGCFSAYCKDPAIRKTAVSGGITTLLVSRLLSRKVYDAAFLVDGHQYDGQMKSRRYTADMRLDGTLKSRYVPVSHAEAVEYMRKHPGEKLIITGTSCAVHGILRVIDRLHLDRSDYLLLGLFCDRCERDGIVDYFKDRRPEKKVTGFYFRTKEQSGWPGNVKIEYEDGMTEFLPAQHRMRVKEIFQLKRCLYCCDKLNQFADISLGDDYVDRESSMQVNGKNLVILRTKAGERALEMIGDDMIAEPVSMEEIKRAQGIRKREKNCAYAVLAREELGTQWYPFLRQTPSEEIGKEYAAACETIKLGMEYPESARWIRKRNAGKERKLLFQKLLAKIRG